MNGSTFRKCAVYWEKNFFSDFPMWFFGDRLWNSDREWLCGCFSENHLKINSYIFIGKWLFEKVSKNFFQQICAIWKFSNSNQFRSPNHRIIFEVLIYTIISKKVFFFIYSNFYFFEIAKNILSRFYFCKFAPARFPVKDASNSTNRIDTKRNKNLYRVQVDYWLVAFLSLLCTNIYPSYAR